MIIRYFKSLTLSLLTLVLFTTAVVWRPFSQITHHQIFHLQHYKQSSTFKYFLLLKNQSLHPISNDNDVVGPYRSLYQAYDGMQHLSSQTNGTPHYLPIERT